MSFYDRRSQSIVIYDFLSNKRVKKIRLKKYFNDLQLKSISVYTKNFDSIFIVSAPKLYMIDSSGTSKKQIDFFDRLDAVSTFDNTVPLVLKNDLIYTGVKNYLDETSISDIKKWKIMYLFDFNDEVPMLCYSLPDVYNKNLYGRRFLDYSYCYNGKGNFIFSFPADTCIYETDLINFQKKYFAKSRFQIESIVPVSKESLKNDEGFKEYITRDSYGAIYYDPSTQRYLRLAKQGVDEKKADEWALHRKQSLIIFNKEFKIIAESELSSDLNLNSLFFTENGNMYVRTNPKDEYALHFVKLEYRELYDSQAKSNK